MDTTLGSRIAELRKAKNLTQEELAKLVGVSSQAVSKWEKDRTCPDITLLPQLAKLLGVTVDELLGGKQEEPAAVQVLPESKRKDIKNMMLRISVDSADGDKVRVNLPLALVKVALDCGMEMPQISGTDAMKHIDWTQIMALIEQGVVGNLVEVESADGDKVYIFVE